MITYGTVKKEHITKEQWGAANGFNSEWVTYIVFCFTRGKSTYEIKDELKERGCVYSKSLGWHSDKKFELPAGYGWFHFDFGKFFDWNDELQCAFFKTGMRDVMESMINENRDPDKSEFMGEIGERLRDLIVEATTTSYRVNASGYKTYCYSFKCGDNRLAWYTTRPHNYEAGRTYVLTGTVNDHKSFEGIHTTILSRCVVNKKED